MDGKNVSELLSAWDNMSRILNEFELGQLIEGLTFLSAFNSTSGLTPLTVYYSARLASIQSALDARLEHAEKKKSEVIKA
jgi:hypothetical protein